MGFYCEILTPYKRVWKGDVDSLSFEAYDGRMQVLAGHERMILPIAIGRIELSGPGVAKTAAAAEGFAVIGPARTKVFVESAEWAEEIDRPRAQKALEGAREKLGAETAEWALKQASAAEARATNRIKVAALAKPVEPGERAKE